MNIELSADAAESIIADWLVVGVSNGSTLPTGKLGEILGPRIAELRAGKDFEGKANELLALYGVAGIAAKRVLLVGLGKPDKCSRMTISRAASAAARFISGKERDTVVFAELGKECNGLTTATRLAALVSGAMLGATGQDLYRSKDKARKPIATIRVACDAAEITAGNEAVAVGKVLGECTNLARELVNQPPAVIYPESFCAKAQAALSGLPVEFEALGPDKLAELKMNCILGVGVGSARTPRLLVLRYDGSKRIDAKTLCLVGKGITFDSGGLSIKTGEGMQDMKCDMAGAAAALAATIAIARLKLPVKLLTIAALAENMPSGTAFRPGDVLTAKNGKTIEILNTDAEGRLVLADALAHAVDLGASHIVDLATLTGACIVALGMHVAGVMSNNKAWSDQVLAAADRVGEKAWLLPMFEEYDDLIKSGIADMKNTAGRWGGAITAAKLLANFVGDVPWAHVDIAGPAFADKDTSYQDGGGTGYFVRTLVELAQNYAS